MGIVDTITVAAITDDDGGVARSAILAFSSAILMVRTTSLNRVCKGHSSLLVMYKTTSKNEFQCHTA